MEHGITEQEWNDYLDGSAEAELRDRIEAHLIGCMSCWEFYEQLAGASQRLHDAAREARLHLTLDDRRLHAMLRNVFTSLKTGEAEAPTQKQIRLWLNGLESVLTAICGAQAAARALHVAARRSPAKSLEHVRPDNWEPFLDRLTAIAAAMCGDTFANLVQERGRL
jgi:hypothetical protein